MKRNSFFIGVLVLSLTSAALGCGGGDIGNEADLDISTGPDQDGGQNDPGALADGAADTSARPCDDGLDCTDDSSPSPDACDHVLLPGFCLIDDTCYPEGAEDPDNQCYSCQTAIATDTFMPDDTLACDDGDGCTTDDRCQDGQCVSGPVDCDDANPCTADTCVEGQCSHEAIAADCDDGDLCTINDACEQGVCKGSAVDCDDGNPCTDDLCDPDKGCLNPPVTSTEPVPCEDGNLCTVGDICVNGACQAGSDPPDCDDGNPCTDDGCVPSKGCVPLPNSLPCDDGDPCTVEDVCKGSVCTPGPGSLSCDDGNICTDDACVPGEGCVHTPNAQPCDDGEPCHLDDFCQGGACVPGPTALACDDLNVCTDDSCMEGVGCQYVDNTAPCTDGSVCTANDTCGAGKCTGTPISCDDGNECTIDSCDAMTGCLHEPDMLKPECRPQIVVDYPPRAATLDGTRDITITGSVTSKAGFITQLVVDFNGTPTPLLPDPVDGSFSLAVTSNQGINTIVIDAQDQLGRPDHVVQSYYYSTVWYPVDIDHPEQSQVKDGMMIFLGPEVWDDNDTSDADDIATIMTLFVKNLDLSGMISNPVATGKEYGCKYKVNLGTITFNKTDMPVDLVPVDGGLRIKVTIKDVYVPFNADFSGNLGLCNAFDTNGHVTVDWITIESTLLISVDANGEPVVQSTGAKVTMAEPKVSVSNFLVDLLKDFFLGDLKSMLQSAFEDQLGATLEDTVANALKSLALDQSFEIPPLVGGGDPIELAIKTRFSSINFTSAGGTLGFWATVVVPKGTTHNPLGSIGRAACLTGQPEPFTFPKKRQLELGLHDDFFNQITYGMYWGGALAIPLTAEDLGQDLSQYGITDMTLDVDFLLPPIISSCNPDDTLLMEIGDISIVADMKLFGAPVKMQIYTTMIAEAEIVAVDGEIGIALKDPRFLDLEIASIEGGLAGAEETMGTLMKETFMPKLLETFTGGALGSFPVPEIDLSSFDPSIPPGSVIAISLEEVLRIFGYTVLSGNVK
ncbi:MAG: hypothetical protein GXP54_13350 [Deltaproteobacteria bacterium]|nr:hypothetical protein [Deltaproteobacteria bacterium]